MNRRTTLLCFMLAAAASGSAQSLTVTPQQVYVLECQETFVTLQGTNLAGTSSTLVDFVAPGGQVFELEPNTVAADQLIVWIPLDVAYSAGNYAVSVKAIDTNGTRTIGPATLLVVERSANGPPGLSLPEVVVVDATSSSGAYVTFDAGGANCDHPSGSLFPIGSTTVTCSASNGFGTTTGTFSVVVLSTTGPPILTLPEVVVTEATSASGANVSFDAGGASCDRASGSAFAMGTTTVTCSMTNSYGTSTGTFLVVVTDTVLPALSLPSDITSGNPVVNYTATATDNIDGPIPVSCSPPSGSTFQAGATTVQCNATDTHANSAYGSFTVTIISPSLSDFIASQSAYQLNNASSGNVTYTSNVPLTLTETLTIRSDATGQIVRTLFSGVRNSGSYQDTWDGKNDSGQLVPDGSYRYFVTVSANGSSFTWDGGTHYAGTTATQLPYALCRNDAGTLVSCNDSSIVFDPYANKPLRVNYCAGAGTPPSCTGTT
ncbi:MAG TPA: FlgD immunoglobulin-like domain containing protein, partial [Gemmatimonadaceae bacterium]|nr:FlgD immunoglobulin-like domain containing protein [Gemmatimonadaceae bacterium]